MNSLPPGTEDIVADSDQTIGDISNKVVSDPAYTNILATYSQSQLIYNTPIGLKTAIK